MVWKRDRRGGEANLQETFWEQAALGPEPFRGGAADSGIIAL